MAVIYLLNIFSFLISLLGFRGIWLVSHLFAILSFDILRIRRVLILKNLDIVFKETKTKAEKKIIARHSMASFFATIFEFIAAKYLFPKAKVSFYNSEILDNLLAKNEGLYAMCLHMSNWEFLCYAHAKLGRPIHVVVKAIGKGGVARWVEELRSQIGFSLIDRKGEHSASKQIITALEKKEVIGFVVDQKRPKGEFIPFFGKEASTNNSIFKLCLRKKAPIFSILIKRKKPGEFEITYFPEFIVQEDEGLSIEQNITQNTLLMNQLVEKMILSNPQEYFWMHNRWDLKK